MSGILEKLTLILLTTVFATAPIMGQKQEEKAKPRVDPVEGKKMFTSMREMALKQTRKAINLPAGKSDVEPFGVVMDMALGDGFATVVAFNDGSASIYLSSGGGWLGGIGHENVRNAAKKTVSLSARFQPLAKSTKEFPLPKPEETVFYLLTDAGVFTEHAPSEKLGEGQHAWSPLFHAAQDIIGQYRVIDQKREDSRK